jgi:hypothetical protein
MFRDRPETAGTTARRGFFRPGKHMEAIFVPAFEWRISGVDRAAPVAG